MYEFACEECGNEFEEIVFSGRSDVACPACGSGSVAKKISAFAFKAGSGKMRTSVAGGGSCSGCHPGPGGCGGCH